MRHCGILGTTTGRRVAVVPPARFPRKNRENRWFLAVSQRRVVGGLDISAKIEIGAGIVLMK
jgi:hypothetical protein